MKDHHVFISKPVPYCIPWWSEACGGGQKGKQEAYEESSKLAWHDDLEVNMTKRAASLEVVL